MKTKKFFFILYSVCSETKNFPELAKNGYLRAFWHLMILTLICSLGFALGNIPYLKNDISKACSILNQEFGGIAVEKNGIYPKIRRDNEHHIEYQFFQMDYFPQQTDIDKLKLNTKLYNSGIIWTPDSATGWLKISNEQIVLYPVLTSLSDTTFFSIYPTNRIVNYIKQTPKLTGEESLILRLCIQGNIPVVGAFLLSSTDNFDILVPSLVRWSLVIVMFKFFATAILNMLFYGLIFALIYRFTSKSDYIGYTFKNFFVVAIYASFPAIIIGTLLSLAQTQWLEYSTIFIIAFVIYLFFILNNLKINTKGISD
jgi:hypothetical protein